MSIRYVHTNIVTRDWRALAAFYERVFDCRPVPPARDQTGEWLDRGTGVTGARLRGMHLRLPGHGPDGPTLEIYQYDDVEDGAPWPAANRRGIGHLAFHVDDVAATRDRVVAGGGSAVGEIATAEVGSVGVLTFVYVADPDGNVIELQHWA